MARKRKEPEIETIRSPYAYSQRQIDFACLVHTLLKRGMLVVVEEPEGKE